MYPLCIFHTSTSFLCLDGIRVISIFLQIHDCVAIVYPLPLTTIDNGFISDIFVTIGLKAKISGHIRTYRILKFQIIYVIKLSRQKIIIFTPHMKDIKITFIFPKICLAA